MYRFTTMKDFRTLVAGFAQGQAKESEAGFTETEPINGRRSFELAATDDSPRLLRYQSPGCGVERSLTKDEAELAAKEAAQKDGEIVVGERVLQFRISTNDVDRHGDTVQPDGMNNKDFRGNPVLLWAHNYSQPPVGRSLGEWVEGDAVKSRGLFVGPEISQFAFMVFQLYEQKFLNAVSIGFIPTKYTIDEADDPFWPSFDFTEWSLLEYSAVPVPANQNALIEAGAKGIDVAPWNTWATEFLDDHDGAQNRQYASRRGVERTWKNTFAKAQIVVPGTTVYAGLSFDESHPHRTGIHDGPLLHDAPPADAGTVVGGAVRCTEGDKVAYRGNHHSITGYVSLDAVNAAYDEILLIDGISDEERGIAVAHLKDHCRNDFGVEPEWLKDAPDPEPEAQGEIVVSAVNVASEFKVFGEELAAGFATLSTAMSNLASTIEAARKDFSFLCLRLHSIEFHVGVSKGQFIQDISKAINCTIRRAERIYSGEDVTATREELKALDQYLGNHYMMPALVEASLDLDEEMFVHGDELSFEYLAESDLSKLISMSFDLLTMRRLVMEAEYGDSAGSSPGVSLDGGGDGSSPDPVEEGAEVDILSVIAEEDQPSETVLDIDAEELSAMVQDEVKLAIAQAQGKVL